MDLADLARERGTMGGVLCVKGRRTVYHAINAPNVFRAEMVLEGGVLYVDCTVIDIGMPFSQQAEATRKMEAFVSQQFNL